jgi:hypothetical protein
MVILECSLEGELHLVGDLRFSGDLVRMEISNLAYVGLFRALKPRMAVLQWRTLKPW